MLYLQKLQTWFSCQYRSLHFSFSTECCHPVSSALSDQAANRQWFSPALFWSSFYSSKFWFMSLLLVLPAGSCLHSQTLIFSVIMPCWLKWPELGFWMRILYMFSHSFPLLLLLTCSAPISNKLPEKSRNSCQNIQMFSTPTIFQPLLLRMEFSTTFPWSLVLQCLPKPPLGSWKAGLRTGGVSQGGEGRYCSMFYLSMVQPSPHGS